MVKFKVILKPKQETCRKTNYFSPEAHGPFIATIIKKEPSQRKLLSDESMSICHVVEILFVNTRCTHSGKLVCSDTDDIHFEANFHGVYFYSCHSRKCSSQTAWVTPDPSRHNLASLYLYVILLCENFYSLSAHTHHKMTHHCIVFTSLAQCTNTVQFTCAVFPRIDCVTFIGLWNRYSGQTVIWRKKLTVM